MARPLIATLVAALCLVAGSAASSASDEARGAPPVVLELFTSQGCSSCPPADRLIGQLARDPSLVVLSRPVTYWDRLGWRDTLAREENTQLQQAYAAHGDEGAGVYTPQVVVNGGAATVGSRAGTIARLVAAARPLVAAAVVVRPADGGGFGIGIGGDHEARGELVLVALTSHVDVAVGRGENSGSTLGYTNVVRAEKRLARWQGGSLSLRLDPADLHVAGADRYALLLREPDGGRVLAGAMLPER